MSPADDPKSSTPSSGWRGRLMRQTQDRQPPPKEVSRWSKTTTESELSEAFPEPPYKRRSFLKKKSNPKRESKDTTKSSPTDPFYDSVTKQLQPFGGDIPPVIITSRPDGAEQNGTFLDDASDDETMDSPTSPVIHRASSVRVSRPQVVQHSNSSAGSVPKLCAPQNTPSSVNDAPSMPKSSQTLSEDPNNRSTPAVEKTEKDVVLGGRDDALKSLQGDSTSKKDEHITALPQVPAEISNEPRDTMKETILEWPDTPSRQEALDTMPTSMGGFGSMRIPRASNGTFSTDSTATTYVSPSSIITDGLRSNPPSATDKKLSRAISAPVRNSTRRVMIRPADLIINKTGHGHKLLRENIVSTPYPARYNSIGELDGILLPPTAPPQTQVQPQEGGRKTPRLKRSRLLNHHTERSELDDETTDIVNTTNTINSPNEKNPIAPEIPLSTKPPPTAPITSKSDRFPSPSAPEILFLDLRLARHPGARVTVEVEVTDKTTFDDEQLFTTVRDKYLRGLMGKGRWWFCARTVEGASLAEMGGNANGSVNPRASGFWQGQHQHHPVPTPGAVHGEFDGADFIRHLLTPRLGRRRKLWLLWLRNHQRHGASPPMAGSRRGRPSYLAQPSGNNFNYSPQEDKDSKATSPVFSFMHSRQNSGNGNQLDHENSPIHTTTTAGTPGLPSKQPSISLGRMPFNSTSYPGTPPPPHLPTSFNRSKSLALSSSYPSYPSTPFHPPSATQAPPSIILYHTFSLRSIALFTLLLLFLAIFTAILWILFGVPGRSAAQGDGSTFVAGEEFPVPWRRDAQARVGVGLVLGVVVLLVGAVLEVGWVWGSWVLV